VHHWNGATLVTNKEENNQVIILENNKYSAAIAL